MREAAGELALVRQIRQRAGRSGSGIPLGIGDDCALLRLRRGEVAAVTTDLSIEGRHFRLEWHTPESVGHRTLARGLSDLAAMGARPVAAFVSLGLPRALTAERKARDNAGIANSWLKRFYDGFLDLADAQGASLAGGDLAESPVAVADIVLVGAVPQGKALLRSAARVGDVIYVTGSLGGAAAGLQCLATIATRRTNLRPGSLRTPNIPERLREVLAPHLYPQPRVAQGLWLRRNGLATAALDISDGLSTDLAHLCEESDVAAEVDAAALPLSPGASVEQALHGGEDYELLFTGRPGSRLPKRVSGIPITPIGRITRRLRNLPPVTLISDKTKQPLEPRGWQHFA